MIFEVRMIPDNPKLLVRRHSGYLAMLFINIYKNLYRSKLSKFSNLIKIKENRLEKYQRWNEGSNLLKTPISINNIPRRFFMNESNPDNKDEGLPRIQLPALTDEPPITMPSFFNSIGNIIFDLGLKRHIDPDFDLNEFMEASKQAVEVISNALAVEDYDILEGLVTNDVINKLKERLTRLSKAQKELIPVAKNDIFGQFAYKIDVNKELVEGHFRKFVDVTMVYYSYKDLQSNQNVYTLEQAQIISSHPEKVFISNYRFRRDYTNVDEPSSWIVTMLNQFMLIMFKPD